MKTIYLCAVLFCLSIDFAFAQTPPQPVVYNYENPSVNQLEFNNAEIATTTPVFRVGTPAGTTNPNLYYIEINSSSAFTGTSWTQTFSGTYVNGTSYDLTFNNAFTPTNGSAYYVRVKASGDGGTTYSAFSSGTYSFTYITSGGIEWYQSTQAQFLTDVLSGTTATASAGVQVNATTASNAFTNGSFETTVSGPGGCECSEPTSWTYDAYSGYLGDEADNGWVSTSTSGDGVSAGSNCLQLLILDGFSGNWYADDYAEASQEVNLTGASSITFTNGYYDEPLDQFDDISAGSVTLYMLVDPTNSTSNVLAGNIVYSWTQPVNGSASHAPFAVTVNLAGLGYTGNNTVRFVNYVPSTFIWGDGAYMYVDDVQTVSGISSGTITSTSIDLGSVKGGSNWANVQWNQTLNNGSVSLAVQKCVSGTWTNEVTGITSSTAGANTKNIATIPITTSYDSIRVVGTLVDSGGTSPSLNNWAITMTGCTTPATPTVSVANNCGNSVLSTTATGTLLWSTGATTSAITVTNAATYSVTTTVGGCTSASGIGISAPLSVPTTPTVSVTNNCGNSVLSTTAAGTLAWSTGATTSSITVTNAATYSVTASSGGCTSAAGTGISAPKATPSTPIVIVSNSCGSSSLSTASTGTLAWSTGASTSAITVTTAATYSVTATVNGCTSTAGTGTAAPLTLPTTPTVSLTNNCGNSVLSTTSGGTLLWSNGASTSSISVTNAATYSVTATVSECTSLSGTGTSAPKAIPATPIVTVVNGCGNSLLSTTATGALVWSLGGQPFSSITVTTAGTYSVTTTVNGCTSAAGTVIAAPLLVPPTPIVTVTNNCGNSVLTASDDIFAFLWSNGATTFSITVTDSATYYVTAATNTCVSLYGIGISAPKAIPSAPTVTVANNCGSSELSTTAQDSLLWSTGATASSITVTNAATYSVTAMEGGCTSSAGTGTSAPKTTPSAPTVLVANSCGSSTLSVSGSPGLSTGYTWSNGATTSSITVTDAATYSLTVTVGGCTSSAGTGTSAPLTLPTTPTVSVTNNCGYSVLSTTSAGTLLWSTGATTSSITATSAATYSVTATVSECTSLTGTGTSAPKAIPQAPTVTVANNCGSSVLSTISQGALLWSTGATTSSITVTDAATYSVTVTVNGCTGAAGTGTSAPSSLAAPGVTVANNCGNSVLTATGYIGSLSWSTGATTSSITVTLAGTYSVTQTSGGCTSSAGTGTAAPLNAPSAPIVLVTNSCGSSLLSTVAAGTLAWSTGATTSSITVTAAATYSVTATVNGCISAAGTGAAAPLTLPSTPVVSVTNNCGYSILSTTSTGALVWSTGATTSSITVTNAATYSVTAAVSECTSSTGTGTSAPNAIPSAPTVSVANNCGSSVLSTTAQGALLWSTGATTSSITVTNAATYSVTATINSCTSAAGTGTSAPSSLAAPGVTVTNNCGSSVLTATGYIGSLSWSTGATASAVTVTTAGTYSVTQTSGGCTSSAGTGAAVPLSVPATPVILVYNSCGSSLLTTIAAGSLAWSTGATTSSITVSSAATYSVTTTVNGCSSASGTGAAAPLTLPSTPVVYVTNNCGYAVLSTTSEGTLIWSTGATASSITVTNAATYSVTTTQSECTSLTGTGTSAPKTTPSAPSVSVSNNCGTSILSTTAQGTLLWSTGATTSSITVTNAASYSVTTTVNGCSSAAGTATSAPSSLAAPGVNVANNCGSSVLTATGYTGTLLWNTGATTSSITVTVAGTYSVTQAAAACTSPAGTGTANPSALATPEITVTNNCGNSVLSTAATGTLRWSTGASTSAITVTASGTYSVTETATNSCSATASTNITVKANPVVIITAGGPTTICFGDSVMLTASGADSYVWHPFEQTDASVYALTPETYFVTGTGANGCSANSDSIRVAVNLNPSVYVSTANGTCTSGGLGSACANPSAGSSSSYSYIWSNNSTTSCIANLSAGTYSVTLTDGNGCKANASGAVIVDTIVPVANAGGDQTIACGSATLQLNGSSNVAEGSYSWTTSGGGNIVSGANTLSPVVNAAGTYTLTVTNPLNGCTGTSVANVTYSQSIDCTISGTGSIGGCGNNNGGGNSTQLCAPSGYASYQWSNGATTPCITLTQAGTYSVTVSNGTGCSSTCSKTVTAGGTPPSCNISGPTGICYGQSADLCAPSGDGLSYIWSTGATTRCITVTSTGTYSVTVTGSGGCSSTCSKCVTAASPPSCDISSGCDGGRMSCDGRGTSLCGPSNCGSDVEFLWSTGATTRCINVNQTGTYSLTVTNGNGCSSTCCKTITIGTPPPCSITGNTKICMDEYTTLCGPDGSGLSYIWSTGSRSQCIRVSRSGYYCLTVTDEAGCSSTCSVWIEASNSSSCCISGNLHISKDQCTTLCASSGFSSYKWNTGETTQCITVRCQGAYCVTVTTGSGCSATSCACVVYDNYCGGRLVDSPDNNTNSFGAIEASAYPNPFSDKATIELTSTGNYSNVVVKLYTLSGQKVQDIYNGPLKAGEVTQLEISGADLPDGVYIYRISSGDESYHGRIILMK